MMLPSRLGCPLSLKTPNMGMSVKGSGHSRRSSPAQIRSSLPIALIILRPGGCPKSGGVPVRTLYQIMRQRLLADRMVERRELDVDEAKVVVVVPEQNVDYRRISDGFKTTSPPLADRFPDLETVESMMRAVLKNPDAHFDMVGAAHPGRHRVPRASSGDRVMGRILAGALRSMTAVN